MKKTVSLIFLNFSGIHTLKKRKSDTLSSINTSVFEDTCSLSDINSDSNTKTKKSYETGHTGNFRKTLRFQKMKENFSDKADPVHIRKTLHHNHCHF
ncbi:hypothetical protein ACR777_21760 [Sphingobacterium spiritivorum]|uniref:hypothetical protein n=1 Tax=Sphingobacterium spiritivorum TaxID=258 RepID=UPI003DA60313